VGGDGHGHRRTWRASRGPGGRPWAGDARRWLASSNGKKWSSLLGTTIRRKETRVSDGGRKEVEGGRRQASDKDLRLTINMDGAVWFGLVWFGLVGCGRVSKK
jgi:hypothetical protein